MNDIKRILKEQNDLLKRLVELQEKTQNIPRSTWPQQPSIYGPTVICQHEYPNPWGATVPPFCIKCGHQAPSYVVTS